MWRRLLRVLPQPSCTSGPKPTASRRLSLELLEDRRLLTVWSAAENAAYFGDLNQHDLEYSYPQFGIGNDNMACGPSAATNSLVYLANAYSSLFGSSLIASAGHSMQGEATYTAYDDWIYTAGGVLAASNRMNTTQADGTYHDQFIWGLYTYAQSVAQGKLRYAAEDSGAPAHWGNSPAPGQAPNWVKDGAPTWNFLYNGLKDSAAVDVGLSYVGGGGHYVSIEAMTWNDVANTGTMTFMNSWTGRSQTTNIYLQSGKIYTDYGSEGSWIYSAMVLAPISAPTGLNAVVAGAQSVGLRWDASAGATSYTLERATSADGTYAQIYNGPARQYTDNVGAVPRSTTYYYRVKASAGAVSSAYSASIPVSTLPFTPQLATADNSSPSETDEPAMASDPNDVVAQLSFADHTPRLAAGNFSSEIVPPSQPGFSYTIASIVIFPEPQGSGQLPDQQAPVDDHSPKGIAPRAALPDDEPGPLAASKVHGFSSPWEETDDSGRHDANTLLDDVAAMLAEIAEGNLISPLSGSLYLVPGVRATDPSETPDGANGQTPHAQALPDGAAQNPDVASRTPDGLYRLDSAAATTAERSTGGLLRSEPLGGEHSTLNDEVLLRWQEMDADGLALSALAGTDLLYGSTGTSSQRQTASPSTDASESPDSPSSSPTDPVGGQAIAEPMPAGDG